MLLKVFFMGAAVGGGAAAFVTGMVAHRWPNLFNKAVSVANTVDAGVNKAVAHAKSAVQKK